MRVFGPAGGVHTLAVRITRLLFRRLFMRALSKSFIKKLLFFGNNLFIYLIWYM